MVTEKTNEKSLSIALITDDQYLIISLNSYLKNISTLHISDLIKYITNTESESKMVLVDDRAKYLEILKYRNIQRKNDFLIILRTKSEEKKHVDIHFETYIDLTMSKVCFYNSLNKYLEIYSKNKTSSFPRKKILTDTESMILKLICKKKSPKYMSEIVGLSLTSVYRHIKNIVNKYDYRRPHFLYDELLKAQKFE